MRGPYSYCLLLIVAAYLLLGVAYSLAVPLGEAPDEIDHFLYVEYLVKEGRLPVMSPLAAENYTMEANQPPLYYWLNTAVAGRFDLTPTAELPLNACYTFAPHDRGRATFYRHSTAEQFPWPGTFWAFHLARFLSLLMGAGTVILAYRLGQLLCPERPQVATAAAALLAFNPQFIFITASVNNDVLMALLGAAIMVTAVQTAGTKPTFEQTIWRHAFWLGCLLGLGFVTKYALFALWPIALLAVVLALLNYANHAALSLSELVRTSLLPLALLTLLPLLIAGWWYWRAWQLYGDPLIWEVHLAAKGEQVVRQAPLTLADLGEFVLVHFQSYWLWLGWLKIKGPAWVYGLLAGTVLAAGWGLLLLLKEYGRRLWAAPRRLFVVKGVPGVNGTALILLLLAVTAVYMALGRYILTINWSGYQGRLAFSVAAPIAALLALGLWWLATTHFNRFIARWLLLGTGLALATLSLLSLPLLILPAYPRPLIYQPNPAVMEQPVCVRLAQNLEIEAITTNAPVQPGETLTVTLFVWEHVPLLSEQTLVVNVSGAAGQLIGQARQSLAGIGPVGHSITLSLPITATALPTRAVLQIGLQDETGQWQLATTPEGTTLPLPTPVMVVKIGPLHETPPQPTRMLTANFGQQVALVGFDWEKVSGDNTAVLTLYWQALAEITADYTMFVHLLDEQGQLVTQHDAQPRGGTYPTAIWAVGETVTDMITLQLPEKGIDGPYRLAVGVYQWETLTHLPVQTGDGPALEDDRFMLPLEVWGDRP
jgi:hypothetical protein